MPGPPVSFDAREDIVCHFSSTRVWEDAAH